MKVVIVGGVAGGMSTAARLRRLDEEAQIVVFERGAHVSFANCGLPYFIGDVIRDRDELLLQTPASFRARFAVDVHVGHEVMAVEPSRRRVRVKNLATGEVFEETYDKLVLSPGAEAVRPPIPGAEGSRIFTLRNIPDTDRIKSFVTSRKARSALVVGGGFIGLEMAENLLHLGLEVTVVEAAEQVMAPLDPEMAAIVHQHLKAKGVILHLRESVERLDDTSEGVVAALRSGRKVQADMVVLSIGVRPESRLAAESGLALGARKGIAVNEYLQTSDPDIYAAGDAIEIRNLVTGRHGLIPLAGPANKQGRIIAENIVHGNRRVFSGAIGTAIAKVFDISAGSTGANEKTLKAEGIPFQSNIVHVGAHAGYYPGATPLSVKLLYAPDSGRVLGGQVVGGEGVDRRLDVLSFAVQKGLTVFDLEEFEHTYAPPFSSAKDPVNVAGMVAGNTLAGRMKVVGWETVAQAGKHDRFLLDVRTPSEYAAGHIDGAVNIPVDELRARLSEVPRDGKVIVYCGVGLRAYVAVRILMQKGFRDVVNLSGGIRTYGVATAPQASVA